MKLVIDIPKEFEQHFNQDGFEDSLSRVIGDIEGYGLKFHFAGKYEKEVIIMLREAFKNSTILPEKHGDLIDRDELKRAIEKDPRRALSYVDLADIVWLASTIIESEGSENI